MTANISEAYGEPNFAYHQTEDLAEPWWGGYNPQSRRMTVEEAGEISKVGKIELELHKLQTISHELIVPCNNFRAVLRTDPGYPSPQVMGIVGPNWPLIPYMDVFRTFFDSAFGPDNLVIDTAGALGNGDRVFMSAHIGMFDVNKDPVKQFLIVVTGTGGHAAHWVILGAIRPVCQNTVQANLDRSRNKVCIKHTRNMLNRLEDVRLELVEEVSFWSKLKEAFQFLASMELEVAETRDLLEDVFPYTPTEDKPDVPPSIAEARERSLELFDGAGDGTDLAGSNRWGLYNSICQFIDRDQGSRVEGTARMTRSLFNSTAEETRQRAFKVLTTVGV